MGGTSGLCASPTHCAGFVDDGALYVWTHEGAPLLTLTFSPYALANNVLLVAATHEATVRVLDCTSGLPVRELALPNGKAMVLAACFATGKVAVYSKVSKNRDVITILALDSGAVLRVLPAAGIRFMVFAPDGAAVYAMVHGTCIKYPV